MVSTSRSSQMLTIRRVARNPGLGLYNLGQTAAGAIVFRPLRAGDVDALAEFLGSLCAQTRRFWTLESYDRDQSEEFCKAIGRYDKLRLVAVNAQEDSTILALYEFSFGIPPGDRERFSAYGLPLDENSDCRFGPCVRDALQGSGLAHLLMGPSLDIARRFGKLRVILWGGVLAENERARRFYTRIGFREVGRFTNSGGMECVDMLKENN